LIWKLSRTGQPAAGNETAKSSNLNMDVKYFNTKGVSLDPSKLKRGEDFIVEVTISNPGLLGFNYENMALQQIFPPGWEINNIRLSNADFAKTNNQINYQDIRDDRVSSFFDLNIRNSVKISLQLTATYPGKYYLPGFLCEAMYDNSIYTKNKGMWVTVL
jgi:alpha-2-macroglobulin